MLSSPRNVDNVKDFKILSNLARVQVTRKRTKMVTKAVGLKTGILLSSIKILLKKEKAKEEKKTLLPTSKCCPRKLR